MSNVLNASGRKLFSDIENKNISTEVISYQNDIFGKQLEEVVEKIYNKLLEKDEESIFSRNKKIISIKPETDILVKLIYDRLGLKVKFIIDDIFMPAGIIPFYANVNHILLRDGYRGQLEKYDNNHKKIFKIIKDREEVKGIVNVDKATVGGIFSEFENLLYINFQQLMITNKLSVQETTAVILHELGHGFYACEYSNRLEETNQVLSNCLKELFNDKDKKDLVYVYKEIKKVNDNINESDIDDIVNGKNVIPGFKLFKLIVGSVETQLRNKKYNESSFEQLADNFSNRFGYGRPLVSALQKLTGYNKTLAYFSLIFSTTNQVWVLLELIILIYYPMSIVQKLLYVVIALINLIFVYYSSGEYGKDYTYDNINRRYIRVRNDLVEVLKSDNLDKEVKSNILKSLDDIDRSIKSSPVFETFITKILNITFSFNRNTKSSINEQQLMEDLVSNDLFIKSEKLKTI